MPDKQRRRRKLTAYFVLYMLLYGYHRSVSWTGPYSCKISAKKFCDGLGISTADLRRCVEYLKKFNCIKDYDYGPGWVSVVLRPPLERVAEVDCASGDQRLDSGEDEVEVEGEE